VNPGTKVRISKRFKKALILQPQPSLEHVIEFGTCVGIAEGYIVYSKDDIGPELEVRWQPSKLKYAYLPEHLIKL
jgi:hypothetical protein